MLKKRHINLLERMLGVQEWQASMVTKGMKAMEEDHRMLDTILALAVSFLLPTAQPLALALQPPGSCLLPSCKCPSGLGLARSPCLFQGTPQPAF